MRIDVLFCVLVAISCNVEAATTGATCTNSFACGTGNCCRDSNNRVLSNQQGGGIFGGPLLGHQSGTCSSQKAQKGDMCDGACQCDTGLTCYRPMSGACCPPSTCMDADYVKKQQAHWSNCLSSPNCALPP